MSGFNSMTTVAAAEMIAEMSTQAEFTSLVLSWGVEDFCGSGSCLSRANNLVRWARSGVRIVPTAQGNCELTRAMIEVAITASDRAKSNNLNAWTRLVSGLKMDGFEIAEIGTPTGKVDLWGSPVAKIHLELRRMLPSGVPDSDFREAASEVELLLVRHGFDVAKGHLNLATSAFQRGEWASTNSQLRSFFESYLNDIADKLGFADVQDSDKKRTYLGTIDPPFLLSSYNEWHQNVQKPQYIQGLWSRMHPEGSHPGLSEEEDATFRFQITLISARLFLRRFDKRE